MRVPVYDSCRRRVYSYILLNIIIIIHFSCVPDSYTICIYTHLTTPAGTTAFYSLIIMKSQRACNYFAERAKCGIVLGPTICNSCYLINYRFSFLLYHAIRRLYLIVYITLTRVYTTVFLYNSSAMKKYIQICTERVKRTR